MTSSAQLAKRKKNKHIWALGDESLPLGGWEDHYIIDGARRNCHPDYITIPIGHAYGFAVCKKKRSQDPTKDLHSAPRGVDPRGNHVSRWNGYHKGSTDMYSPWNKYPRQITNPQHYTQRVPPNYHNNMLNDYTTRQFNYNGTGVYHTRTTRDGQMLPVSARQHEYGMSYLKTPPPKYDVRRGEQPYPIWKAEREYQSGQSHDSVDLTHHESRGHY